jgi:hypothetical protein
MRFESYAPHAYGTKYKEIQIIFLSFFWFYFQVNSKTRPQSVDEFVTHFRSLHDSRTPGRWLETLAVAHCTNPLLLGKNRFCFQSRSLLFHFFIFNHDILV